jgi:hypothetical protein
MDTDARHSFAAWRRIDSPNCPSFGDTSARKAFGEQRKRAVVLVIGSVQLADFVVQIQHFFGHVPLRAVRLVQFHGFIESFLFCEQLDELRVLMRRQSRREIEIEVDFFVESKRMNRDQITVGARFLAFDLRRNFGSARNSSGFIGVFLSDVQELRFFRAFDGRIIRTVKQLAADAIRLIGNLGVKPSQPVENARFPLGLRHKSFTGGNGFIPLFGFAERNRNTNSISSRSRAVLFFKAC